MTLVSGTVENELRIARSPNIEASVAFKISQLERVIPLTVHASSTASSPRASMASSPAKVARTTISAVLEQLHHLERDKEFYVTAELYSRERPLTLAVRSQLYTFPDHASAVLTTTASSLANKNTAAPPAGSWFPGLSSQISGMNTANSQNGPQHQTHSSCTAKINELLRFPIRYCDLPRDTVLCINIISTSAENNSVGRNIIAGTTISIFGRLGVARTGLFDCRMWLNTPADYRVGTLFVDGELEFCTTPATPSIAERSESDRLSDLQRQAQNGMMLPVDWLDRLAQPAIERIKERHRRSTQQHIRHPLLLTIQMPEFVTHLSARVPGESRDKKVYMLYAVDEDLTISRLPPAPMSSSSAEQPASATDACSIYDPELDEENLVESKHHVLMRGLRYHQRFGSAGGVPNGSGGSTIIDLILAAGEPTRPNAEERDKLTAVIEYPSGREPNAEEQDLVWRFRHFLADNRYALSKFLCSVKWNIEAEAEQARLLMRRWAHPKPADALELLSRKFQSNQAVRQYAVERLAQATDDELITYLLQLVQALRYEQVQNLRAALRHDQEKFRILQQRIKLLRAEMTSGGHSQQTTHAAGGSILSNIHVPTFRELKTQQSAASEVAESDTTPSRRSLLQRSSSNAVPSSPTLASAAAAASVTDNSSPVTMAERLWNLECEVFQTARSGSGGWNGIGGADASSAARRPRSRPTSGISEAENVFAGVDATTPTSRNSRSTRRSGAASNATDSLASLLISRATRNVKLGTYFWWYLRVELENKPPNTAMSAAAGGSQNAATKSTSTTSPTTKSSPNIRVEDGDLLMDSPTDSMDITMPPAAGANGKSSTSTSTVAAAGGDNTTVYNLFQLVEQRFLLILKNSHDPQCRFMRRVVSRQVEFVRQVVSISDRLRTEGRDRLQKEDLLRRILAAPDSKINKCFYTTPSSSSHGADSTNSESGSNAAAAENSSTATGAVEQQLEPLPLPLDPDILITGVRADKSILFKSAQMPARLHFIVSDNKSSLAADTASSEASEYVVIFKPGDDLRQDQLVLQMTMLMDELLRQENLDLRLTPYKVLATSIKHGFVQYVANAIPLSEVLAQGSIQQFLRRHARDEAAPYGIRPDVMESYVKSCAGYCIITYLLGVGDRHYDNLLLMPKTGRLFHIDFSYILGRDPKPMPPPMKLSKEMVDAMGGEDSHYYQDFKRLSYTAFLHLRRHANLILNLFALMVDTNIADIALEPDKAVKKVQDKFRLDLNDEEAVRYIQSQIDVSITSVAAALVEQAHKFVQYWRK